eukprot:1221645-Pyramimonas_sp.AAC.1
MTGDSWTRSRVATLSSNKLDTTDCQGCACGEGETDPHRSWTCSCNGLLSTISQIIIRRAQEEHEACPCLWFREVLHRPGRTWASRLVHRMTRLWAITMNFKDANDYLSEVMRLVVLKLATHGFGGLVARAKLSRSSADLPWMSSCCIPDGGGIPLKQTIYRGETTALLRAAGDISGL